MVALAVVAVAVGCVAWPPPPAQAPVPPGPGAGATDRAPAEPPVPVPGTVAVAVATSPSAPVAPPRPASLQGTEADGAWRADAQGRLVVDRALRRRLDYALSALGEQTAEAIGAQWLAVAQRELPSGAFQELQALWQRYLQLQQHPWQRVVLPADTRSWRPALEERQSVRRLLLGRAAADAFYGDEERLLWQQILALESGSQAVQVAEAPPPEHPQAAERVAAVEAAWADWGRRLDAARAEQARLRAAPELSAPQRDEALARWLARHFDAQEQRRVRALLGLPVPG